MIKVMMKSAAVKKEEKKKKKKEEISNSCEIHPLLLILNNK